MQFNKHYELEGQHAFLSASKHHWTNYDDDKLVRTFHSSQAARRGDQLHALAADLIRLKQKLPRSQKTLNLFVNDALGFRMEPEQILFVTRNAFGTADAISFRNNVLRIHDLKTGETPTSMRQLEIYAAFFCLEYRVKPSTIEIELRMYKLDEVQIHVPDTQVIENIMERTLTFDRLIEAERAAA